MDSSEPWPQVLVKRLGSILMGTPYDSNMSQYNPLATRNFDHGPYELLSTFLRLVDSKDMDPHHRLDY